MLPEHSYSFYLLWPFLNLLVVTRTLSPPTKFLAFNYGDTHTPGSTFDHSHSSFNICCVKVFHFEFSDLTNFVSSHFSYFSTIRLSRTRFDIGSFLQEN